MALTFYTGQGSPYGWRVFLALERKGIPYELKILSFSEGDTKKPGFRAVNARGKVPTIVDDGFVLGESLAILEYLDERFPDQPKLYRGDAKARARTRRLILEVGEYLNKEGMDPIFAEFFDKGDAAPDAANVEKARTRIREELEFFSKELGRGPFFGGAEPDALDFVFYPEYAYVKRITFRKPDTGLTELVPKAIAEWGARIEALPYFDKTYPAHWR